jgi:hypothetical protein
MLKNLSPSTPRNEASCSGATPSCVVASAARLLNHLELDTTVLDATGGSLVVGDGLF